MRTENSEGELGERETKGLRAKKHERVKENGKERERDPAKSQRLRHQETLL